MPRYEGEAGTGNTDLGRRATDAITAFNGSDWDRIRELYTADTVYEEIGSGNRLDGVETLIAGLQTWKQAMPDVAGDVTRVTSEGDTTSVEIVWRGTQTGPLPTPAGTLPASGRAFTMEAVMISRWVDGKVAHERHHLDMLALLSQLGAIPAPA